MWQSKWHARMDELTATKGKVARLKTAVSTPADDWLEQHDAEARREERERIAQLVEGKGYASWHFNYSSAIAAAIRESTG